MKACLWDVCVWGLPTSSWEGADLRSRVGDPVERAAACQPAKIKRSFGYVGLVRGQNSYFTVHIPRYDRKYAPPMVAVTFTDRQICP